MKPMPCSSSPVALLTVLGPVLLAGSAMAQDAGRPNMGLTLPAPVFQNGDTPSQPLPEGSPLARGFVDFMNRAFLADGPKIAPLSKKEVVWFPPQRAGDTSLELVARAVDPKTANCGPFTDVTDPAKLKGQLPQTYPLYCEDSFSTGQFCQACHDSALFVEGGGLPEMMYLSEDHDWLANWSQYGDWSGTIMRLATRDPIWQAQIETETLQHPYADPHVIQNVCFSCHGEMGERQLKLDIADHYASDTSNQNFCTDVFYATIPGILSSDEVGAPYPFSEACAPIEGLSVGENPALYAKYGSLSRDGVSCETCHRIGPEGGAGEWDRVIYDDLTPEEKAAFDPSLDPYAVFYGPRDTYHVAARQTENPVPLQYEFTATFDYDLDNILIPDPLSTPEHAEYVNPYPMQDNDNLAIAQGLDLKTGESYLGQSVICGSCHVLIVPEIPTAFQPGMPIPNQPWVTDPDLRQTIPTAKHYKVPAACRNANADKIANGEVVTFAPSNRTDPVTRVAYGDPLEDVCVALGYEQATYLEWINSDFASEQDNDNTCQGCHMPLVTDPNDLSDHTAILAQSTQGLIPKTYRRHRLMGINLPVSEMFMQFPDVLGVAAFSDNVPDYANTPEGIDVPAIQNYLLNAQMAIVDQATSQANGSGLDSVTGAADPQAAVNIQIVSSDTSNGRLVTEVVVTNNAGHKFPSGAGFRRGFLRFEVLDASGAPLWVSGATNPWGAICSWPCTPDQSGAFPLLPSETPGKDPANIEPHHQTIRSTDEVQIYEIVETDDLGNLTSKTLSLFGPVKDNRILPRGFHGPTALGCDDNPQSGTEIFGIPQCSAAYATAPEATGGDPAYANPDLAGEDRITYDIDLMSIKGTPAAVRVTMQYQTIPPGFLAARFQEGHDGTDFLPATKRAIYLTSHLNTNLPLTSTNSANVDLTFSQNWTSSLYQVSAKVAAAPADSGPVLLGRAVAGQPDAPIIHDGSYPFTFYQSDPIEITVDGTMRVVLASTPDGLGQTHVDDQLVLQITTPGGTVVPFAKDYSNGNSGRITPVDPIDLSRVFKEPGTYKIMVQFRDLYPNALGASDFYLVPMK